MNDASGDADLQLDHSNDQQKDVKPVMILPVRQPQQQLISPVSQQTKKRRHNWEGLIAETGHHERPHPHHRYSNTYRGDPDDAHTTPPLRVPNDITSPCCNHYHSRLESADFPGDRLNSGGHQHRHDTGVAPWSEDLSERNPYCQAGSSHRPHPVGLYGSQLPQRHHHHSNQVDCQKRPRELEMMEEEHGKKMRLLDLEADLLMLKKRLLEKQVGDCG